MMIKKLMRFAIVYAGLALLLGLYYRELEKAFHFEGVTVLSNTHVHGLVLGTIMMLILIMLDKQFQWSSIPSAKTALALYRGGVDGLITMLVVRGTLEVMQTPLESWQDSAISGIAGLTHILLAFGIIYLLLTLQKAIVKNE
jgi:uncharacterized membrane protein